MKERELTEIRYTRATSLGGGTEGDTSERTIIPMFIPGNTIRAVDVSELSADNQGEVQTLMQEYAEYYQAKVKEVFSFGDWVEHTQGKSISVKWRTFKRENMEVVD